MHIYLFLCSEFIIIFMFIYHTPTNTKVKYQVTSVAFPTSSPSLDIINERDEEQHVQEELQNDKPFSSQNDDTLLTSTTATSYENKLNNEFDSCLSSLICTIMIALSIYTLVITHNNDAVSNACGPGLWNMLLARCLWTGITMILICCCDILVIINNYNTNRVRGRKGTTAVMISLFTLFIITLTFTILDAVFALQAMGSGECMVVLDNTTTNNNGRMLPIVLCVYMGIDTIIILFFR